MPYIADRVQETSTTSGTGSLTLAGAVADYRSFATAFGSAALEVVYTIDDGASNWEVGYGNFNGTTTLSRDVVLASSNAGALVSLSGSSANVWSDAAAVRIQGGSLGRQYSQVRGMAMP